MKKFLDEFKAFISRGNVMDMAVGVIIGASFKAIVDSLVADIINPLLGMFGGMNFSEYNIQLPGEATLNYGNFITAIINFLIMAFIIFCLVKFMNRLSEKFTKKKRKLRQSRRQRPVHSVRVRLRLRRRDVHTVHPSWKNPRKNKNQK